MTGGLDQPLQRKRSTKTHPHMTHLEQVSHMGLSLNNEIAYYLIS